MTDSKDYRLYLDERFNGLTSLMNAQFKDVHERFDKIEEETKETNGRVTDLEKSDNYVNCPNTKAIKDINDGLLEYSFLKKYPKLSVLVISFFVIIFAASCFNIFSSLRNGKGIDKIESTK